MTQQPSGWYDDPSDPMMLRYWDGVTWTSHTAPKKSPTASQSTIGLPQQQAPTAPLPQGGGWRVPDPRQDRQGGQGGYQRGQDQGTPPGQYPGYGQYPQAPQNAGWMTAGPSTVDGVRLASWGRRAVARILDNIVTSIISIIIGWSWVSQLVDWYTGLVRQALDSGVTPDAATVAAEATKYAVPIVVIGIIVGVVYETFFLARAGATPGKMALGISVRRTTTSGALDVTSALKRQLVQLLASATNAVPALGSLFGVLSFVDYLWPLWDSRRQALHDKIADTQVVMGRQPRRQA